MKRLFTDVIIIITLVFCSALIANELRADRLPLFPDYMNNHSYRTMDLSSLQQDDFKTLKGLLFDARPHELYEKDRYPNAKNFPVSRFDFFCDFYLLNVPTDIPVFIYGRTLSSAFDLELAYLLHRKGYTNITVLM